MLVIRLLARCRRAVRCAETVIAPRAGALEFNGGIRKIDERRSDARLREKRRRLR